VADFPDFLYRLTPRDEQVTQLELYFDRYAFSDTAALVGDVLFTTPNNRILVLTRTSIAMTAGAAQNPLYSILDYTAADGSGPNIELSVRTWTATTGTNVCLHETQGGPVYVPPSSRLTLTGAFSAGVNANSVVVNMQGFYIPRGTIAI